MDRSPPGSSVHGILQARILEWVTMPSPPGDLPDPGIKLGSPALQADSLTSEPPGKQGSTHYMNGNKQFPVNNGEKETRVAEDEMVK